MLGWLSPPLPRVALQKSSVISHGTLNVGGGQGLRLSSVG
jgi:hypothetical protein